MPLKSITKGEGSVLKIATAQRRPIKFTVSFYVRLTGLPPGAVDKGDQAIIEQQLLLCCRDFYASRCDTAWAMNSGPTGSVMVSRRIRSISVLAEASSDQPITSSTGCNWSG